MIYFYPNSVVCFLLVTFSTRINISAFVILFVIKEFVFHDDVFNSTKVKYLIYDKKMQIRDKEKQLEKIPTSI